MDMPVAPAGEADRGARAGLRSAPAGHEDPRLRPQLVRAPRRHRHDAARRGPRDRLPHRAAADAGGALVRRDRLPLLRRRPVRQTELHDAFPDKGSGSPSAPARTAPTDPPAQVFSDTLKWHAATWCSASPATGARPSSTGTSRSTRRRPAQRRLRHLHRRGHRRPGGTVTSNAEYYTLGHLARFVAAGRERGSPARRSAPPAGTAQSWTPRSATPTARPRSSCTTRTTTRARSPSPRAVSRSTTRCPAARSPRSSGKRAARRRPPAARPPRRLRSEARPGVDDDAVTHAGTGSTRQP